MALNFDSGFSDGAPPLKWLRKVANPKHKLSQTYCLVEGWKSIQEATDIAKPEMLLCTEATKAKCQEHPWAKQAPCILIQEKELQEFCSTKNPEGVLGVFEYPSVSSSPPLGEKGEVHLGLYQWRDPSNVGAVVRTARGLGIKSITMIGSGPKFFSTKVIRTSMGSVFHMPLHHLNVDDPFFQSQSHHFVCATATGQSSRDWSPKAHSTFLMIGSESHGFDDAFSSRFAHIGVPLRNDLESLSAPIASALLMDHLVHASQTK